MFPLFLNFLLCCLPECYSWLRFFACLFYFLLSFYFSLSYYLPGLCYQICYAIDLFSTSAVSSCVCDVTKLFLQGSIVSLSVCYVIALFAASILPSTICYVTVLSLKGFQCFITCLSRHCSVLGFSCLLFCLLRIYDTILSHNSFRYLIICFLRHCSVLGLSCLLFCLLRHNAIFSGFPLFYYLFVTSLLCSPLQLCPLMFVMSSILSLHGFHCFITCLLRHCLARL